MSKAERIISSVDFQEGFTSLPLAYDDGLGYLQLGTQALDFNNEVGFWQLPDEAEVPVSFVGTEGLKKVLLGFGIPISRQGGIDTAPIVTPLVNFDELPGKARTIDLQGKGVGPQMYNTPQGVSGMAEVETSIGVFLFTLPERLLDKRLTEGSTVDRIWRHGNRIIQSNIPGIGLRTVIEKIHDSFQGYDAVLYTQPPRASVRQKMQRRQPDPAEVPAQFMIIRSAQYELQRIGKVVTAAKRS